MVSEPARLAALDEAVEPRARLRLRIVTVDGTTMPRGDERGGVLVGPGPGSLERADCTRASSRCICAVRVRMWVRELDCGSLLVEGRADLAAEDRWAGVRIALEVVATRVVRVDDVDAVNALGFGVMLFSAEGSLLFRCGAGVFSPPPILGKGNEASDMGGDGGSWSSSVVVSAADIALRSGGVMIIGELAVECGELQNDGDPGIEEMSVEREERWRDSCFLILACRISASILRSASSSRSRCESTRSCCRS